MHIFVGSYFMWSYRLRNLLELKSTRRISKEAAETLSSRIPKRVREEFDRQVYEQKMKGKKVTSQDVVTTILIRGLGMSEEAKV
jgi:hypothetical protein